MEYLSNIMIDALRFFAYFGGYGWGIVWLTIAVNLALYPLTLSSIKSMEAMQRLQPRLQELQKKHKDKPQELQKETMDAYKAEGINPLGGCLPVLLKIPFFLALFWALQSNAFMEIASNPANNTSFLWLSGKVSTEVIKNKKVEEGLVEKKMLIKDEKATKEKKENVYVWNAALKIEKKGLGEVLSYADESNIKDVERVKKELNLNNLSQEESAGIINAWKETNSLAKPERLRTPLGAISIFAVLIGITTFLMQKSMPGSNSQQAQMMTWMMPAFIVFISWNFPAGVQIYWVVSNLIGAAQQYYIMLKPRKKRGK